MLPCAALKRVQLIAAQMGIEPYTCKIMCSSLEQNLNHIQIWNQVPCPIAWRAARSQIKVEKCSRGSPFPVTEQGVFVVAVCFVFVAPLWAAFCLLYFVMLFSFVQQCRHGVHTQHRVACHTVGKSGTTRSTIDQTNTAPVFSIDQTNTDSVVCISI